jgi:DNA-binding PadR family transcriptional regulator
MALGELEQVILFAIAGLGGEAHGASIVDVIEESTGKRVSPGALYTVLERLEGKGFVQSWLGDSTPERGGRRRKVYRIQPEGARQLRSWYRGIQRIAAGTVPLLDRLADEGIR